jgi:hypothetical protein
MSDKGGFDCVAASASAARTYNGKKRAWYTATHKGTTSVLIPYSEIVADGKCVRCCKWQVLTTSLPPNYWDFLVFSSNRLAFMQNYLPACARVSWVPNHLPAIQRYYDEMQACKKGVSTQCNNLFLVLQKGLINDKELYPFETIFTA